MAIESMDVEPTDVESWLHKLVATETKWNSLVTIDDSLIIDYSCFILSTTSSSTHTHKPNFQTR